MAVAITTAYTIFPAKPEQPTVGQMVLFIGILAVDIMAFSLVALAKGPTPRWRWGKKPTDNSDEDF